MTPRSVISRTIYCSRLQPKSQIEVYSPAQEKLHLILILDTVGGIYSVLKSKAPVTTAEYGDRYTLIGPLNRNSVWLLHYLIQLQHLTSS